MDDINAVIRRKEQERYSIHATAIFSNIRSSTISKSLHAMRKNYFNAYICILSTYLELWPIHRHIYTVIVRPPFQIFFMVRIVNCMIEFFVYLWKSVNQMKSNLLFKFFSKEINALYNLVNFENL